MTVRAGPLATLAAALLCQTAAAGPLDAIYDDAEIAPLAPLYERGWRVNYDEVFRPALSASERRALDAVRFRMETRIPDAEPVGFLAGQAMVRVSAASIRFLEDMAMAYAWLDRKGYQTQTVADYLLMLRHWTEADGRPPRPFDALCIPSDAFDDQAVAGFARKLFDTALVFVLLHEYGHILHRHPGNRAVAPEISRANEAEADRFAMDQFVRVGDMPAGVPLLFFVLAHLLESRGDFASDAAYRMSLAARTHPVSPERLRSLARHMGEQAANYDRNARPGSDVSAMALGLQISQLGLLLADGGLQRLSNRIGETAIPTDLAPRRPGALLAPHCGQEPPSPGAFSGLLSGRIADGGTSLAIDAILQRAGDAVSGTYSYGGGFGRIVGEVAGETLSYRWTLPPEQGSAILTRSGEGYEGTFGYGTAATGGGMIRLDP